MEESRVHMPTTNGIVESRSRGKQCDGARYRSDSFAVQLHPIPRSVLYNAQSRPASQRLLHFWGGTVPRLTSCKASWLGGTVVMVVHSKRLTFPKDVAHTTLKYSCPRCYSFYENETHESSTTFAA